MMEKKGGKKVVKQQLEENDLEQVTGGDFTGAMRINGAADDSSGFAIS